MCIEGKWGTEYEMEVCEKDADEKLNRSVTG